MPGFNGIRLVWIWRTIRRAKRQFWPMATVLLLLNFFLLTYNVHFSRRNGDKSQPRNMRLDPDSKEFRNDIAKGQSRDSNIISGYQLARNVQNNCKRVNTDFEIEKNFWITRMHLISKHSSIYCPVEKVGTTFWRRFIYQLNHTAEISNPFEVSIYDALTQSIESLANTTKPSQLGDYFKFTFVRDPYNRILSAYIDKLFAPNPLFWRRFGEPAISMFRGTNGVHRRRICSADPTFTEFLQFVTWAGKTRKQIDGHILMASEMCIICSMNYTFIGRMENFKADSSEIFKQFGVEQSSGNQHESMSTLAAKDAIEDTIASPFGWKKAITKCMGWFEALLRIWRKLQMRGLIEMKHKLPVKREAAREMSKSTMLKIALVAHKASNPSVLKQQKRELLIEMYRNLPDRILSEFRDVYRMDFKLFDYDETPGFIFNRTIPYIPKNFTDFRN